jgi:hypothetical protein
MIEERMRCSEHHLKNLPNLFITYPHEIAISGQIQAVLSSMPKVFKMLCLNILIPGMSRALIIVIVIDFRLKGDSNIKFTLYLTSRRNEHTFRASVLRG